MPNPSNPQALQPPLDPRVAIQRRLNGDQGSAEQFVVGNARPINKEVGGISFGGEVRREKQGWKEKLVFWRKTETVGVSAGAIAKENLGGPGTIKNRENQRKIESLHARLVQLREEIPDLTQEELDSKTPEELADIRSKRELYMQLHDAHKGLIEFQTAAASLTELENPEIQARIKTILESPDATQEEKAAVLQSQAAHLAVVHWGISRYHQRYELSSPNFTIAREQVRNGARVETTEWYQSVAKKVALEYNMQEQSNIVVQAVKEIFDKEQNTNTSMEAALGEVEGAMLGVPRPELRAKMSKQELRMQQDMLLNLRKYHFVFRVLNNETGPQAVLDEYNKYLALQRAQFISEGARAMNREVGALSPENQSPTLKGLVRSVEATADEYQAIEQTINPALAEAIRKQQDAEREYNSAHQEANSLRQERSQASEELQNRREDRVHGESVKDFHIEENKHRSNLRRLSYDARLGKLNTFLQNQRFTAVTNKISELSATNNLTKSTLEAGGVTRQVLRNLEEEFDREVLPEIVNATNYLYDLQNERDDLDAQLAELDRNGTALPSDHELMRLEQELISAILDVQAILQEARDKEEELMACFSSLRTAFNDNNTEGIRQKSAQLVALHTGLQTTRKRITDPQNRGGQNGRFTFSHSRVINDCRNRLENYAAQTDVVDERNARKRYYRQALSEAGERQITALQDEIRVYDREIQIAERKESETRNELDRVRTESAQEAANRVSREVLGSHIGEQHELVRGLERELMAEFRNPRTADKRLAWCKILNFLDRALGTEIATPYTAPTPAQQPQRRRFQGITESRTGARTDRDNTDWDRADANARQPARRAAGSGQGGRQPQGSGRQGNNVRRRQGNRS